MKTGTKLLLAGAVAAGAGALLYRKGIDDLQFSVDGYAPAGDLSVQMRIKVYNPSALFGYPVPAMLVNAYDSTGSFVGTIINHQLQWISRNGISYIYGTVQPNYQNLAAILTNVLSGGSLPQGLTFHGMIKVGRIEIPFETGVQMAGISSKPYDLGYFSLGNGITVADRNREVNGDYKKIAHISEKGEVTWYVKRLPDSVRGEILSEALKVRTKISGMTCGADYAL